MTVVEDGVDAIIDDRVEDRVDDLITASLIQHGRKPAAMRGPAQQGGIRDDRGH